MVERLGQNLTILGREKPVITTSYEIQLDTKSPAHLATGLSHSSPVSPAREQNLLHASESSGAERIWGVRALTLVSKDTQRFLRATFSPLNAYLRAPIAARWRKLAARRVNEEPRHLGLNGPNKTCWLSKPAGSHQHFGLRFSGCRRKARSSGALGSATGAFELKSLGLLQRGWSQHGRQHRAVQTRRSMWR
jgi:hypothetical protein